MAQIDLLLAPFSQEAFYYIAAVDEGCGM